MMTTLDKVYCQTTYYIFRLIKAIIGHSFIEVFQRKNVCNTKQMRSLLYRVATDVCYPPVQTGDIHYSLAC